MQDPQDFETIDFVPSICKAKGDKPAEYEGKIVVRLPEIDERKKLIEAFGFDTPGDETSIKEKGEFVLGIVFKSVELISPFIHAVEIKRLSDGKEFKSAKALGRHPALDQVFLELKNEIATTGIIEKN